MRRAKEVVEFLKEIAVEERLMIVATIHQPAANVFLGFDQLLMMSRGATAYRSTHVSQVHVHG